MSGANYTALLAMSAAALVAAFGQAAASGFALREQSGSLLGQAFAGQNAYATDPSVIFFNPQDVRARRHAGKRWRRASSTFRTLNSTMMAARLLWVRAFSARTKAAISARMPWCRPFTP